jgi:hypothetical protein
MLNIKNHKPQNKYPTQTIISTLLARECIMSIYGIIYQTL